MTAPSFDFTARWVRAASSMQAHGVDALFVMKPANLAYLTGDGRPCALGLLTRNRQCIVAVPASDVRSVRTASAATERRSFGSEEEMFHGFRDVLKEPPQRPRPGPALDAGAEPPQFPATIRPR